MGKDTNNIISLQIDYSYQLMLIADQLTNTELGYSFYITDVTYDNFAVNKDGKVLIVDLEDILIVDRAKIKRGILQNYILIRIFVM